jgi:hypothetical protein
VATRKVDRLACIRFASACYSVPVRLIGTQVKLRTDDGRLLVIMTPDGTVVAEHFLVPPGEASVRDEHYGGPGPGAPARAVRPRTAARARGVRLGRPPSHDRLDSRRAASLSLRASSSPSGPSGFVSLDSPTDAPGREWLSQWSSGSPSRFFGTGTT